MLEAFGLDPDVLHLNHGAFGVAPVTVRQAAAAWRERAERNPHRFNRTEVSGLVAAARQRAAAFLGVDPARAAWVRNVSEGMSAVLGSLDLRPGDELVTSTHGYGAVGKALRHHAGRAGARVVKAAYPGRRRDDAVTAGVRHAPARPVPGWSWSTGLPRRPRPSCPSRPWPPPSARPPAGAPVLVDAAHAPGQLRDDIAALGADHWIGNLHKWAYTPRGSAILWSRPGADVTPGVLSWQLDDGYARPSTTPARGTTPAGWRPPTAWRTGPPSAAGTCGAARPPGRGRPQSGRRGPRHRARRAPGVARARACGWSGCPRGPSPGPPQADALYEALSRQRVEVAPVHFGGAGYLRIAAAPYNTPGDYERLGAVAAGALGGARAPGAARS